MSILKNKKLVKLKSAPFVKEFGQGRRERSVERNERKRKMKKEEKEHSIFTTPATQRIHNKHTASPASQKRIWQVFEVAAGCPICLFWI